jgi:hypothetical protein
MIYALQSLYRKRQITLPGCWLSHLKVLDLGVVPLLNLIPQSYQILSVTGPQDEMIKDSTKVFT